MKAKNSLRGVLCPWLTYYILNIRAWLIALLLIQSLSSVARQPSYHLTGTVVSASGKKPLPGATVKIEGQKNAVYTNNEGKFTITTTAQRGTLLINFVGFSPTKISFNTSDPAPISVTLSEDENLLQEVQIVSTGYQQLPKERATGSFTFIDNKTLNRAVSPDLISRLNGVTNGLLVDKTVGFNIRGRSTIFASTAPLVVIDNFPFEGDINTINPNDVETVTLLKDAAAASIWGVRAGNGVLVITTKKGKANEKTKVEFNSNLTVGGKPDLYYQPQLSSSEFIDLEKALYEKGAYTTALNSDYMVVSPVVELLQKATLDPDFAAQANAEIDALRGLDVRNQLDKYYYRNSTRQQYHFNIRGGSPGQTYFFSAGYDKDLPNDVAVTNSRITLKGSNTYSFLADKLTLSSDITYTRSEMKNTNAAGYSPFLPYEQITDENGNALPVLMNGYYRSAYTDTAGNGKLLDWKFRPLDELRNGYSWSKPKTNDYRILLGTAYKVLPYLTVSANYQYFSSNLRGEVSYGVNSFYTRDMINKFSQINPGTGEVIRPIETGDIFNPSFSSNQGNYGRVQADFRKVIADKHEISALAGYEVREDKTAYNSYTLYGYKPSTATSQVVDAITQFPYYYNAGITSRISNRTSESSTLDRYISYYVNASYTYDEKYIVSGSYRKDESNLFGVRANQKGVPLWSAGFAWNVHKEAVLSSDIFSFLQLRATYGYNGNVDRSLSAYLTAEPAGLNTFNRNYYSITNPPNEDLRWERVRNINLALEFATKARRLSGSVEYFSKKGIDLIGSSPIAPQTGRVSYTGNTANSMTRGVDLQLNSLNTTGRLRWTTTGILNIARDRVTEYKLDPLTNASILTTPITPIAGYPVRSVFAYRWRGLDATGEPRGELNGEISTDYLQIRNSMDYNQLDFYGSAVPTLYGSLRNTFSYKKAELSFALSYKYGYYFRRSSVRYGALNAGAYMQADFDKRWQNPGDELITDVPAWVYPATGNRDEFYQYSSVLVEKGNQIRLQDIRASYTINKSLDIYCYATNLGILWKANRNGLDPDVSVGYPVPLSIAFGLKAGF